MAKSEFTQPRDTGREGKNGPLSAKGPAQREPLHGLSSPTTPTTPQEFIDLTETRVTAGAASEMYGYLGSPERFGNSEKFQTLIDRSGTVNATRKNLQLLRGADADTQTFAEIAERFQTLEQQADAALVAGAPLYTPALEQAASDQADLRELKVLISQNPAFQSALPSDAVIDKTERTIQILDALATDHPVFRDLASGEAKADSEPKLTDVIVAGSTTSQDTSISTTETRKDIPATEQPEAAADPVGDIAPSSITIVDASRVTQKTVKIATSEGTQDIVVGNQVAKYIALLQGAGVDGLDTNQLAEQIGTTTTNILNMSRRARDAFADSSLHLVVTSPHGDRLQGIPGRHNLEFVQPTTVAAEIPAAPAAEALDEGQTSVTEPMAAGSHVEYKNGVNPRLLFDSLPVNRHDAIAGYANASVLVTKLGYKDIAELKGDINVINATTEKEGYRVVYMGRESKNGAAVFIEQIRPVEADIAILGEVIRTDAKEMQLTDYQRDILPSLNNPLAAKALAQKVKDHPSLKGRTVEDVVAETNADLEKLTGIKHIIAEKGNEELGFYYEMEGVTVETATNFYPVPQNGLTALDAIADGHVDDALNNLRNSNLRDHTVFNRLRSDTLKVLKRGRTNIASDVPRGEGMPSETSVYTKLEAYLTEHGLTEVQFLTDLAQRVGVPTEAVQADDVANNLQEVTRFTGDFTRIERGEVVDSAKYVKEPKGKYVFPGESEATALDGVSAALLHELAPDGVFNAHDEVEHILTTGQLRELAGLSSDQALRRELSKVSQVLKGKGYRLGFVERKDAPEQSGVYVEQRREPHGEVVMKGDLLQHDGKEIALTTDEYQLFNRLRGAIYEDRLVKKHHGASDIDAGDLLADQIDRLEAKLQALTGEPVITTGGNEDFGYFFEVKGFKTHRELEYLPTYPSRLDTLQAYIEGEHDRDALIGILGNTQPSVRNPEGRKLTANQAAEGLKATIIRLNARNAAGMATERELDMYDALSGYLQDEGLTTRNLLVDIGKTFGLSAESFRVERAMISIGRVRQDDHTGVFERIDVPAKTERDVPQAVTLTEGVPTTVRPTEASARAIDLSTLTHEVQQRVIALANQSKAGLVRNAVTMPNLAGIVSAEFGTMYPTLSEEIRGQIFDIAHQAHMTIVGESKLRSKRGNR